jgi:microcystin-dependent protein
MGTPYIGEIRMFGGNFNPNGWAMCDGALQPISQNDALFQLIGTTYGGDGQSTFALPDLQGRIPLHQGQSTTGSVYVIGQKAGVESVTLTTNSMPTHSHAFQASTDNGLATSPTGNVLASNGQIKNFSPFPPTVAQNGNALTQAGGSQPHDNMMPYLVITFIISLFGIFPSQN